MNASADVEPDQPDDACSIPSQLLTVEMLRRPLESTQYVSIRYTERLAEAGIEPSVGSAGDSYDNALAETIIGLYKTEGHPPLRPLAEPRRGRVCHAPMGRTARKHSARRVRSAVRWNSRESGHGGQTQLNESPENSGRFSRANRVGTTLLKVNSGLLRYVCKMAAATG